jgi:hypothetical protein
MEITEERNSAGEWSGLFTITDDDMCGWGSSTSNLASFTLRNMGGTDKYQFYDQIQSKDKSQINHRNHFNTQDTRLTPGRYTVKREIKQENGQYKLVTDITNIEDDSNKHVESVLDQNTVQHFNSFDPTKMHLCAMDHEITGVKITDVVMK